LIVVLLNVLLVQFLVVTVLLILAVAFLLAPVALINATLEPMTIVVILVLVNLEQPAVAMTLVVIPDTNV